MASVVNHVIFCPLILFFVFHRLLSIKSVMDPKAAYIRMSIGASDTDLVKFKFKKQGKFCLCFISFLSKRSPKFEEMFNEKSWNGDTIELDDQVNFDEHFAFSLFLEALVGSIELSDIDVYRSCCIYYYAEKYQVNDLKSKLKALPCLLVEKNCPLTLDLATVINESNLVEMKDVLDNRIKLFLTDENALDIYKTCSLCQMKNLMAQIVDYIAGMEYDSSWPPDLLLRIAKKNRKELGKTRQELEKSQQEQKQMKQMFDGERQFTKGCINLCGKRPRKSNCDDCYSMWAKIKKVD